MFTLGEITKRILAYCLVSVLFLFANHCFLEEACASLGKVDLGAHPQRESSTSENDPCHGNSSDSEKNTESCPIIGLSLHKSLNHDYDYFVDLNLEFSKWTITELFAPISFIVSKDSIDLDLHHLSKVAGLLISLDSAPQAPPLS